MIHLVSGDMFDRPADVRVCTVNTVGAMGKGVALTFKRRYPRLYTAYHAACLRDEVQIGRIFAWTAPDGLHVACLPTKRHWLMKSVLDDVSAGLAALREYLRPLGRAVVTVPALGCGCGGLDFDAVRPMVEAALGDLESEIYLYRPEDSRAYR